MFSYNFQGKLQLNVVEQGRR